MSWANHAKKELRDGKTVFQIGNNCGGINGWVGPQAIYGLVTNVES